MVFFRHRQKNPLGIGAARFCIVKIGCLSVPQQTHRPTPWRQQATNMFDLDWFPLPEDHISGIFVTVLFPY